MDLTQVISSEPFVERLGWALIHFAWQGAAVALLLGLALLLLRRHTASARYTAGCLAMLVMAALPLVTVLALDVSSAAIPSGKASPSRASLPAYDQSLSSLRELSQPSGSESTPDSETARRSDRTDPALPIAPSQPLRRSLSRFFEPVLPWIVLGWVAGVFGLSVRLLGGLAYAQRLKRRFVQPLAQRWQETLNKLSRRLRVNRPVKAVESGLARVPTAIGWLRPVILLPASALTGLPQDQLEALIAHELAHIRRHDYLVNLLQTLIETLLFYHPAVWWVSRRIRLERENCCDDLAVAACGDEIRYARALAHMEELRSAPPQPALAASGGSLLNRIRRILLPPPRSSRSSVWLAGAIVIAAVLTYGIVSQISASASEPEGRPQVVSVWPGDGATEVNRETEIRIRFDRPMDPLAMRLEWKEGGYYERGQIRYEPENNGFIIPLLLKASGPHRLVVNPPVFNELQGFQSTEGLDAETYGWSFTVGGTSSFKDAVKPQVVSIHPALGSRVGLVTEVRIRFDQPMDLHEFRLAAPNADDGRRGPCLIYTHAEYDPGEHQFTVPLLLPPDWEGDVELRGFRSTRGGQADPIRLDYSTGQDLFSQEQLARFARARQSPQLQDVIQKVERVRLSLTSLSETVNLIYDRTEDKPHFNGLESRWATFKVQGDAQFCAHEPEFTNRSWYVGSDGNRCWSLFEGKLREIPFEEFHEKHVIICDPFLTQRHSADAAIEEMNLEYLGTDELDGRVCHLIQSWKASLRGDRGEKVSCSIKQWWIDGESYMPVQLSRHTGYTYAGQPYGSRTVRRFIYDRVNETISDVEFSPEGLEVTSKEEPVALDDEWPRRYLSIGDGSSGKAGIHWGRTRGPYSFSGQCITY